VSISDEHALQDRLDQAFQAITPRPAPLDQAVRQGRVIRVRRRLAATAGLAVVVAAGIAVPALLHQQASQPALNRPRHPAVTVHPAGPHAPAGLIAYGTAGGQPWQITADKPGTGGARPGGQCFDAVSSYDCAPVHSLPTTRSDPVSFTGSSSGSMDAQFGPVSAAVSYVTVRLADGTVLTLHPVSVFGTRYVAYAVPARVAVSRITAYSVRGELASAIPFNGPDGTATVGAWLRPGRTGLRRGTHLIGSGTLGGRTWSVTAHVGPWGECLVAPSGVICDPVSGPQGTTSVLGSVGGPPELVYGSAAPDVDHLVITLDGGQSMRIPAVLVGGQKLFAFALGRGQHAVRWRAYDAARHETSSGPMHTP
jgi:hypothetical protein